jgi:Peptidase dimerisation domain.
VEPPSAEERRAWASLPFDEKAFAAHEARVTELTGEPEVGVLERLWARPTFEVHGIRGGFIGEGAKTVIPARAVAKIRSASSRISVPMRPSNSCQRQ